MRYNQDKKWMEKALKYAIYAQNQGEVPVGAVLILEQRIIGIGWNSSISKNDPTAHAEIIALRDAGEKIKNYRLLNTTLYVTLQPCLMCFGAIINSRIHRLVFGADSKNLNYKCSFENTFFNKEKDHKLNIQKNVMKNECSNILVNFFHKKRSNKC